jgi:hypothetical protein
MIRKQILGRTTLKPWATGAAMVALAVLTAGPASADVVLHPGTVSGSFGVTGWTFQNGNVQISGNAAGFSASTSVYGSDSYSLTIEGNQTYSYINWYGGVSTSNGYGQISVQLQQQSLNVPGGGTVNLDLAQAGGTVHTEVSVTGGSLASSRFSCSGSAGNVSASGYCDAYTASDCRMPMTASSNINVSGSAKVNVLDPDTGALLCTTDVALNTSGVVLADGGDTAVPFSVTVGPESCASGITGKVGVTGLPGGVEPNQAYVYASGPSYVGQSLYGNNQTYAFQGIAAGRYYLGAYVYFPAPYDSEYLSLPNQDPSWVDIVTGGGVAVRDFLFQGGAASGTVEVTGPWAGRVSYGNISFSGQWTYDYTTGKYGPTAGGYAGGTIHSDTSKFNIALTPGDWTESQISLGFYDYTGAYPQYSYMYTYGQVGVNVAPGATTAMATRTIPTSEGRIVFDVIEPVGSPTIGISSPQVNAYFYNPNTGAYTQISGSAGANNAASPSVRLVGVPGTYQFDAYATVQGSYAKFATSTITLGEAVDTPIGTHVQIVAKDPTGGDTPISLDFGQVTGGGSTTASLTDVGPAAPADYTLLKVIQDKQYINVSSSATFPGQVQVCISYDANALNLTSAQEASLKLQQYSCDATNNCAWTIINGRFDGGANPDTVNHLICGLTNSLSTFGVTKPNVTLVAPTDTCVGTSSDSAQLDTAAGQCSRSVDNSNQLAGGCSGGGGGLQSCAFDGQSSETLGTGEHAVVVLGTAVDGSTATCTSYVRVVDREKPLLSCPAPVTVECTGLQTSYATTAACSDNCATCSATCGTGSYGLGTTAIGCNATDSAGNGSSCSASVTVVDTQAPSATLSASPTSLWPPNKKMIPIALNKTAADACDTAPVTTCTATSSEVDSGAIVWQAGQLFLKADRLGTGPGRTYTITCTTQDKSGNKTVTSTTVTVPHDQVL